MKGERGLENLFPGTQRPAARDASYGARETRAVFIRPEGRLARFSGTAAKRKDGPLLGGAVKRL